MTDKDEVAACFGRAMKLHPILSHKIAVYFLNVFSDNNLLIYLYVLSYSDRMLFLEHFRNQTYSTTC